MLERRPRASPPPDRTTAALSSLRSSRPLEGRQLAVEQAPSALERGKRQRTFRDHVGGRVLVPYDKIRGLADFHAVVGKTQRLRRAVRDHLEADAEVLRAVALNDSRV